MADNQSEFINKYNEYITDVWYKPINSIILEKRLSMLIMFSSEAKDVSEFISNLSFDIKNPMASIYGYSNILLSEKYLEPLSETQNKFVSIINLNASRLQSLVDNLKYDFQIKYGVFTFDFDKLILIE